MVFTKKENKILTVFCFTDVHNQQSMLEYPTTVRKSLITAQNLAVQEFGLADMAIMGGDNVSDYPYWNLSCALPKKNFLDIKKKMDDCVSSATKSGKVLYVAGNNDMILGDIATEQNQPYNTTDFYDCMDKSFGELPEEEKFIVYSALKPNERYLGAFHYVVNGVDFIGVNIHPDTAYNSHEGYYDDQTLSWVKDKLNEIDGSGTKPVFVVGHLSAVYYYNDGTQIETMINGNVNAFYDVFKGHKNAFYLYGHVHGENACYMGYSSGAVLHLDEDAKPLDCNRQAVNSLHKHYAFTFVHMGGLRPFGAEYFYQDGFFGLGGAEVASYQKRTGTPKLAQYMVFEVYEDKVVFYVRNAGDLQEYTPNDKPQEYTVFFVK